MGWPACQVNYRAEEELVVPEFLMKAADGKTLRAITIVVVEKKKTSHNSVKTTA